LSSLPISKKSKPTEHLGKNANFENKALYMAQMTSSNYEVMKKCRMATYFPFSRVLPLAYFIYYFRYATYYKPQHFYNSW
jgi:hypothetical protein